MTFSQKLILNGTQTFLNYKFKQNFKAIKKGDTKKLPSKKSYMMYIHIPFCHTFCTYCGFHKYIYDELLAKKYFQALREEIKNAKELGFDFDTLYVGGGTTLINENELLKTLELCKSLFSIKEISCESDPNHIKPDKLRLFNGLIDRLSCGVQSFDDEILKKTARYQKFGSSKELIKKLEAAIGILPIFSIDLIFNFPAQNEKDLLKDLQIAQKLNPTQITTYPLMKSKLTKKLIAKSFGKDLVDKEFEFYKLIQDFFKAYQQNNCWSFSLEKNSLSDEYVSYHNEYVGFGSGAFSFLDNKLLVNAFDLNEYESLGENKLIAEFDFKRKDILRYNFLSKIFSLELDIDKFNENFTCDIKKDLSLELALLKFSSFLFERDKKFILSDEGKYLFVLLMKEFYTNMDTVRAFFKERILH